MTHMGRPEKALQQITARLQPGEDIRATVAGVLTEGNSASGTQRGMLVATTRRFLFQGTTLGPGSSESVALPWNLVSAVDVHKNLMTCHVIVQGAGGARRFLVKYAEAVPFAEAAQQLLGQQTPAAAASASSADELAKLAALRQQGVLTDAEFTAAKARLLS
jgi:hypothetical protein